MARVHIVMASYNGETYIREQLDSLLNQTFTDFHIEVCDDGSTDRTKEIVREYEKRDGRVSLHCNEENLGYVQNFMQGVLRSEAPYTMLCDQDDIWNPDKIEVTLAAMEQAEKQVENVPVLVYTDAMNYDSETGKKMGSFHANSHLDTKKVDTAHLFMENKCIGCTVMVNGQIRSFLQKIPEEIRVHDWWLALICSHFGKVVYVNKPTLLYRQHSGNIIGGSSYTSYVKKRLSGIAGQKEALRKTYRQGRAFLALYRDRMDDAQLEIAEHFAGMEHAGWLIRRIDMIKYGFTKSGFVRNAGLFFLL
ncbi:MAG: glycosyltransferase [Lachnospiraceae bacterium]|nr:glycosyltransferase [Lachnospiraceae bacterium]